MRRLPPDGAGLAQAAQALRAGRVVACPTETVYGLAVDPFSEAALERLFAAKGRAASQTVLLVVSSGVQLEKIVSSIPPLAEALMEKFWPGPLSLILPGHPGLPAAVRSREGQVCVRQTASGIAAGLCDAFGGALVSTSANLSARPPAMRPDEIDLPGVDLCIDGGELRPSAPSTIVDTLQRTVVRPGAIPDEILAEFLSR